MIYIFGGFGGKEIFVTVYRPLML